GPGRALAGDVEGPGGAGADVRPGPPPADRRGAGPGRPGGRRAGGERATVGHVPPGGGPVRVRPRPLGHLGRGRAVRRGGRRMSAGNGGRKHTAETRRKMSEYNRRVGTTAPDRLGAAGGRPAPDPPAEGGGPARGATDVRRVRPSVPTRGDEVHRRGPAGTDR